jgi:acetyl esterase/lipase
MSLISSCQPAHTSAPVPDTRKAYQFRNISYGTDSLQRVDVYLPANRSRHATPVMILVHGGGWSGGSKSEFDPYIEAFRKRMPGYAYINVNYRLVGNGTLLPQQESDIRAALAFVKAQAGAYDIDAGKIVLLGASAGAHLALLQAYKHPDSSLRAVIDFFGPADLPAMAQHPWHPLVPMALQMVLGSTYKESPSAYQAASPVHQVSPKSPPTLIFHGSADPVVDVSQSKSLAFALDKAGIANQLVIYPGLRHGWHGASLEKSFDTLQVFLEKHLP